MNTKTNISVVNNVFVAVAPFFDNYRLKSAPDRKWVPAMKHWELPTTSPVAQHLLSRFHPSEFTPEAHAKAVSIKETSGPKYKNFPSDWKFKKYEPLSCQLEALNKGWGLEGFAAFMDMGTGKTFTTVNMAAARYENNQIAGLLVVCPTSIKGVWEEEFEELCPIHYDLWVHESGLDKKTEKFIEGYAKNLKVLVIGVESLSQGGAYDLALSFVQNHACMMAIDESSTIKTPPKWVKGKYKDNRTSRCWSLGSHCKYRVALTGTEITQGIQDLFAQYRFLDTNIIGYKNYTSFRAKYCVMGGFGGKKIIGYANIDELMTKIKPYTYRVKITDVHDMPEQIYEKIYVQPNPEQERVLKDFADPYDMGSTMDGKEIEIQTVLERIIRYQQVVGGFFPYQSTVEKGGKLVKQYGAEPIPGKNPKLEALIDTIETIDQHRKIIIWARFEPEQRLISEKLKHRYGPESTVLFKGGLSKDERREITSKYQNDDKCRFFVSGGAGYRGITLTRGTVAFYYSNTFSYDDREQSERRPWRTGQKNAVVYIDLIMKHKIDKQIITAVRQKKDMALFVAEKLEG